MNRNNIVSLSQNINTKLTQPNNIHLTHCLRQNEQNFKKTSNVNEKIKSFLSSHNV